MWIWRSLEIYRYMRSAFPLIAFNPSCYEVDSAIQRYSFKKLRITASQNRNSYNILKLLECACPKTLA